MSNSPERPATKILIVADTPANPDLLRDILQPAGYQTFFAISGQKALQIAASMVPDLILLDVTMPDMDGFETCRRIKTQDELRDIPLIFLTTGTDVEDLARGFDAGSVDYITKPIKRPEVLARVATHLQIRVLIKQQQEHLVALERAKKELQELNEIKDKFLSNLGREVGHALGGLSRASEQLRQSAAGRVTRPGVTDGAGKLPAMGARFGLLRGSSDTLAKCVCKARTYGKPREGLGTGGTAETYA